VLDPHRQGKPDYARITETYWTIDGPRSRLTDRVFSSYEEANKALVMLQENLPGNEDPDAPVTKVLYGTVDPDHWLLGSKVPAMTTLLYRVCDNDSNKFEEATRLVQLFIEETFRVEHEANQINEP